VLYCPGHSAGHCCFEIPEEHLIFFSDIDLTSFGPWYGGLDSDIRAFEQSIKDLIAKSPKTVITSHKGIFTDEISEKLYKYLKTIKERVPHALIYGRIAEPKAFYLAAEQIMLQKHLAILLEENKIEYSHGKYKTL
jgi:glyoxylase-like metal-dependent hydrolase (beta-lactamase superfamily II)